MTAPSGIDPAQFLHEQLAQAGLDLLRQMLTTFINTLMSAEADSVCGAEYGTRSAERVNVRDGTTPADQPRRFSQATTRSTHPAIPPPDTSHPCPGTTTHRTARPASRGSTVAT